MSRMPRICTRTELYLLCLSAFCLPLFEAPKNVASLIFIILWSVLGIKNHRYGNPPHYEWSIIGLMFVLLFSSWLSDLSSIHEASRWTILAIFVIAAARLTYTSKQSVFICIAVFLGQITAVGESMWAWVGSQNPYPEFRSVGHVNHSVMYSNVAFGLGAAATVAKQRSMKILGVCSLSAALVYWTFSISVMGAMTMTSMGLAMCIVCAFYKSSLKTAILSIALVLTMAMFIVASPLGDALISELSARLEAGEFFAGRDKILNSVFAVWKSHPLVGTGWFSFKEATSEQAVREALARANSEYNPSKYLHTSHGHNLWATMLIERGVVGVGLTTFLLISYLLEAIKWIKKTKHSYTFYRWYGVAILLTTVGFAIGGLGNTTMMNEHGQAGMLVIAVASSRLRSITSQADELDKLEVTATRNFRS